MASTAKNWYILSKGKKVGPVSEQNLISFYEQKKINGGTKVAKIGMKAWVSLSESGIIAPDIDDLPQIPAEDAQPAKKSGKATTILAVVCAVVTVVAVFAIFSAIQSRKRDSANSPSSGLAISDPQESSDTSGSITTDNGDGANASADLPDTGLISLDKIIANEWVSIQIPSSWDYLFDDYGGIEIYPDKENKEDIFLKAYVPSRSVYGFITDIHETEDFVFDDGGVGVFVKPSDDAATFVNMRDDNETVLDVFVYEGDWYNENEELIYAIARTLTFEAASGEYPGMDDIYVDNFDYSIEDSNSFFEYTTHYDSLRGLKYDVLKGTDMGSERNFIGSTTSYYNFPGGSYARYEVRGNYESYSRAGNIGLGLNVIQERNGFRVTEYYKNPETGEAFLYAMDPYASRIIMYGITLERDRGPDVRGSRYFWSQLEITCAFHEKDEEQFLEIINTFRYSIDFEGEPAEIKGDWNALREKMYGSDTESQPVD